MPIYSDKVMEHFMNPRNVGEIEDADGIGEVGNPVCGDMMTFYIKVDDDHLSDVKFKTFGCGAAIAVSSIVSEMAKGKTLEKAKKITPALVAEELEGLPKNKYHCSNLGAQALNKAIDDYLKKQGKEVKSKRGRKIKRSDDPKSKEGKCFCPYCEEEVRMAAFPYCQPCGVTLRYCSRCQIAVVREAEVCPQCGGKLEGK